MLASLYFCSPQMPHGECFHAALTVQECFHAALTVARGAATCFSMLLRNFLESLSLR